MYKYEIVANEIVSYLRDQQRDGNRTFVLNAKDCRELQCQNAGWIFEWRIVRESLWGKGADE